ncbi:14893_t:CDS:2, partial [Racocetra persica]
STREFVKNNKDIEKDKKGKLFLYCKRGNLVVYEERNREIMERIVFTPILCQMIIETFVNHATSVFVQDDIESPLKCPIVYSPYGSSLKVEVKESKNVGKPTYVAS